MHIHKYVWRNTDRILDYGVDEYIYRNVYSMLAQEQMFSSLFPIYFKASVGIQGIIQKPTARSEEGESRSDSISPELVWFLS